MNEWLDIYRSYTAAELGAEIERLKKWSANPFATQTEGGRSYTVSPREVSSRLQAATIVKNERASRNTPRHGVADFSGIQI